MRCDDADKIDRAVTAYVALLADKSADEGTYRAWMASVRDFDEDDLIEVNARIARIA